MRRIATVLVLATAVSLGGCATQFGTRLQAAWDVATVGVTNPIDNTRLQQIESGVTVAFAGLEAWKKSCAGGLLPPVCYQQIAKVQVYTRQVPVYLTKLRMFVKNNDQVNAATVYNALNDLISTAQAQAAAAGVKMGN